MEGEIGGEGREFNGRGSLSVSSLSEREGDEERPFIETKMSES